MTINSGSGEVGTEDNLLDINKITYSLNIAQQYLEETLAERAHAYEGDLQEVINDVQLAREVLLKAYEEGEPV